MEFSFRLNTLRMFLICAIGFLSLAGLGAEFFDDVIDSDWEDTEAFFSLSHERNLPTWFSTLVLFSSSVVLAGIALAKQQAGAPYLRHWWGLSLIFAYISLDEFVSIHEDLSNLFDYDGVLHFGWVIPAFFIVVIFVLSYLRFLTHLEPRERNGFVLAGAIYVGGALGMELPLGWWTDRAGRSNFVYALIDLVEETMEMIGASLFLYTLVRYIGSPLGSVRIALRGERA